MKGKTVSFYLIILIYMFSFQTGINAESAQEQVPIIFIHGYNSSEGAWKGTEFRKEMEERLGSKNIHYINYGPNSRNDITSGKIQSEFKKVFEQIIDDPKDQVDVVAHSMGGLGIRWFLRENPEYLNNIRHVQFIATPHKGAHIAFINRLASVLEDPELYYDLEGETVEQFIAPYQKLYEQYIDEVILDSKAKLTKFPEWIIETHPDVFERIYDRQTEEVPYTKEDGAIFEKEFGISWFESTEAYRYSGAFEEYVKLMHGKYLYLSESKAHLKWDVDIALFKYIDNLHDIFDRAFTIGPGVGAPYFTEEFAEGDKPYGVNSVHNMAQDRLMSEYFKIPIGIDEDGRLKKTRVVANPFLHKLNKDEYKARYAKVRSGEKIPIYTTLRGEHSGDYFDPSGYASQKEVGNFDKEEVTLKVSAFGTELMTNLKLWDKEGQDGVVPLSSAKTRRLLFDRNVFYDLQSVSHSGLIHLTDVLKQQYDNPLTNKNDLAITEELNDYLAIYGVNPLVLKTSDRLKELKSMKLQLSSQSPLSVWIIKRDDQGNYLDSPEKISLKMDDTGKAVSPLTVTYDKRVHDYLLFSADNDLIAQSYLKFSVTSEEVTEEELNEFLQTTEQTKDAIYQISPLETAVDVGLVNHRFKVTHNYKQSDESVKQLTNKDFKVFTHAYGDRKNKSPIYPFEVVLEQTKSHQEEQNIVLALDYSGSMQADYALEKSKNAAEDYIAKLPSYDANTSISVVGFSDTIHTFMDFTKNYDLASLSVHKYLTGGTSIYDTVIYSVDLLKHREGKRDIILMTDGSDTSSEASIDEAIAYAKDHDISLYLVALGGDINPEALEMLASGTGGEVFYTHDASQLDLIYENITTYEEYIFNLSYMKRTKFGDLWQLLFSNLLDGAESDAVVTYVELTNDRSNEAVFAYDFEQNGVYRHWQNVIGSKITETGEKIEGNIFEPVKENIKDRWSFLKGWGSVLLW